jgi:hypothetical protein
MSTDVRMQSCVGEAGGIYTFTTLPLPSDLRGQVESFWQ